MPRKVQLIMNPMADMGNAWRVANDLRAVVNSQTEVAIRWSGTVYPSHAVELARQAALEGCDLVIALGGDGTCHEVINGLMQVPAEKRPPLGIVPIGSGNDFAQVLKIPLEPEKAMLLALQGQAAPVDVGLMTDDRGRQEYFNNTVGMGFDAVVTIHSHRLPILRGFLMYLVAVLETIMLNHTPHNLKIKTDQREWQQQSIMMTICNSPQEGGSFRVAPDASPTDGILDYLLVDNCSRLTMLRLIPQVMKGAHTKHPIVHLGKCKTFQMQSDQPIYMHLDGEVYSGFGSTMRQVNFEILPGALQVVRP